MIPVPARFVADRLVEYLNRDDKPDNPLDFQEKHLEAFMARTHRRFFSLDMTLSMALVQAVIHFAEYLNYHQELSDQEKAQVMSVCRRLYDKITKTQDPGDAALRLCPTFESLWLKAEARA